MSIIGAALPAILGLVGGGLEAHGAAVQSHKGRKFAREQSATVYQRSVADMKAAGLNPNAIFGSGGGSPAPVAQGGYSNQFQGAGAVGDSMGRSLSKGEEYAMLQAQARIAQANARQAESNADLTMAENSAYRNALNTDAGKVGAVTQRYGSIGGVGEVTGRLGIGNALGGENSASSLRRTQDEVGKWIARKFLAPKQWEPKGTRGDKSQKPKHEFSGGSQPSGVMWK